MPGLEGRVAIVTGGSRGIGRAIVLELARRGAKVVVNYVSSANDAQAVVDEIKGAGGDAQAVQANVGEETAVEQLIKATVDAFGRIDILVNNAGRHAITSSCA